MFFLVGRCIQGLIWEALSGPPPPPCTEVPLLTGDVGKPPGGPEWARAGAASLWVDIGWPCPLPFGCPSMETYPDAGLADSE